MVQPTQPEDGRAGNGMKTKSCCATKQLGINNKRQRPEFCNSHKLCLSHKFGTTLKKRNRQKLSADLVKYYTTARW